MHGMGKRLCHAQVSMIGTVKFSEDCKAVKIQLSASKTMTSIFWDSRVMHVDSLSHDVHQMIQKKRSGKVLKILLHDSAHPHMANLATMGQEIMNYPPYSPKLTSSDSHLFGPMTASRGHQ
jgi:mevalonate pyrophosphate decarboxylase